MLKRALRMLGSLLGAVVLIVLIGAALLLGFDHAWP